MHPEFFLYQFHYLGGCLEVRFWYLRGPQGVNGVSSMAKMDIFTEGFSEELHNLFTKDYAALSSY